MSSPEISCETCPPSACCQGGIIELSLKEAAFILKGGSKLMTISQPVDYHREDVILPSYIDKDPVTGDITFHGGTEPLEAGYGRYIMEGTCGYLKATPDGDTHCSQYEKRPQTCQRFEVGGSQCVIQRQIHGVDEMSEVLIKQIEKYDGFIG